MGAGPLRPAPRTSDAQRAGHFSSRFGLQSRKPWRAAKNRIVRKRQTTSEQLRTVVKWLK